MRILFVNERLGYFGGVEQNVADLARALGARGHACALAWGEETGKDAAGCAALFASVHPCRELGAAGGSLPGGAALPYVDIVQKVAPDAVFVHKVARAGFALDGSGGARRVRMVHDHDLCCPVRHKYFRVSGRVCRRKAGWRCLLDLAPLCRGGPLGFRWEPIRPKLAEMRANLGWDALLAGSTFMRDELVMNGFPAGRVEIVPPVPDMADRPAPPPAEEPVVLFVGQLIRGKGVDLLLQALKHLRGGFRCVVAGDGKSRAPLEALAARLGLAGRVHFAGWASRGRLEELYAAARVVAVPSRWPEPFGMIGVEAMSRARPVAAFAVGGIPDWLEDGVTGLLVPEQDARALACALERLLADPAEAQRLGAAGRERYEHRYRFAPYVDRIEAILRGASRPSL